MLNGNYATNGTTTDDYNYYIATNLYWESVNMHLLVLPHFFLWYLSVNTVLSVALLGAAVPSRS
jgi:hypothetical protein